MQPKRKPTKPRGVKRSKSPGHPTRTTGKLTAPLCSCDVPPREDCEHTEALAHRAMQEMLGACV